LLQRHLLQAVAIRHGSGLRPATWRDQLRAAVGAAPPLLPAPILRAGCRPSRLTPPGVSALRRSAL